MTWAEIVSYLMENFVQPALVVLTPFIIAYIKKWLDQLLENKGLREQAEAISTTIDDIQSIVYAAVAKGMDMANKMKGLNIRPKKLTPEEGEQIKNEVTEMVWKMLPPSITSGKLLELIGGKKGLVALIDNMIEAQLLQVKADVTLGKSQ